MLGIYITLADAAALAIIVVNMTFQRHPRYDPVRKMRMTSDGTPIPRTDRQKMEDATGIPHPEPPEDWWALIIVLSAVAFCGIFWIMKVWNP